MKKKIKSPDIPPDPSDLNKNNPDFKTAWTKGEKGTRFLGVSMVDTANEEIKKLDEEASFRLASKFNAEYNKMIKGDMYELPCRIVYKTDPMVVFMWVTVASIFWIALFNV